MNILNMKVVINMFDWIFGGVDENGEVNVAGDDIPVVTDSKGMTQWMELNSIDQVNTIIDELTKNSSSPEPFPIEYHASEILGGPLRYNTFDDPAGRVYNNTFMSDPSEVILIPGSPLLNKKLVNTYGGKLTVGGLMNQLFANENGDALNFGARHLARDRDLRFIGFNPDYSSFYKYADTLFRGAASYMGLGTRSFHINLSDFYKNRWDNYGICMKADKSTSISEDADNSYGSSRIAEMVGEKNRTVREVDMFLSKDGLGGTLRRMTEWLKASNPKEMISSMFSYDSALTRTANSLFKVVNGSQLVFPDQWEDSKFGRSYHLSFKFYSPYGDKFAILKYVYAPFCTLLAFALPKSDGILGYSQPFLIRIEAPGWFAIDMGVVTSLTIKKGTSDSLWTVDGLPQGIEVDMEVQDLYPAMAMAKTQSMYNYNVALKDYLMNMGGLRTDTLSGDKAIGYFSRWLSGSFLNKIGTGATNIVGEALYDIQNKVSNMFG